MADSPAGGVTAPAFAPVDAQPDFTALEHRILERWQSNRTFDRLRERNTGGDPWSFIDGPITANNPMGVHHAWGRTLKDIYQRVFAYRGRDQRYQNGFDCQGLWVEVEVEKALGLNSKKEIEDYGLDRFSRQCRDRVAEYSEVQTAQSVRLGQWMDWDNDYYTLSDTNISYIWKFIAECHKRGWLYEGHRPMVWCPRCGTSLSQHELIDSYKDVTHPSLTVRFAFTGEREGEGIAIWTTTPWTLPANVAAAVRPDATYALVELEQGRTWIAQERLAALKLDELDVLATARGEELAGTPYRAPFAHLPAAQEVEHRVVAWSEVSLEDGTGAVHIAPGCGAEDYELGKEQQLGTIVPVDEAGVFVDGFGELTGIDTHGAADIVVGDLKAAGVLIKRDSITHRYPSCWRCQTELIFRLVDEWFISCDEIRQPMIEANRNVEWVPSFYGKRMENWLENMGDWCISRKRYWGLPLPFYHCESCDTMHVLESKEQLAEYAVSGLEQLEELHRPWIDNVTIRCPGGCGAELTRVTEVGDCWLDAGIVPFSTMGWKSPEHVTAGYATGASVGLSTADLPSHDEWEKWFPAEVVIEMREQIRLWFYAMLFMSVVLDGRAPYKRVLAYEKVHDETGRAMHKSWGNAIWFDEAVEKMGADVMRWQYARQTPSQNLNFGYGPADEIRRRFLTLWNVYGFFVTYAELDGWTPDAAWLNTPGEYGRGLSAISVGASESRLDRWLAARTHALVAEVNTAFDRWDSPAVTRAVERFIEELSNWYVRRSRRRFWKAADGEADRDAAYRTLWGALVTLSRVIAPVMPFLADELWENLVVSPAKAAGIDAEQFDSVHLEPWAVADADAAAHPVLGEVDAVQRVVALGRAARNEAQIRLRQPLAEVIVHRRSSRGEGTADVEALLNAHLDDVLAELGVKQVTVVDEPGDRWSESLMPLLPKLGPKYGPDVAKIRAAIAAGDIEPLEERRMRVGEFTLEADEYEPRSSGGEGLAVASDLEWVVGVSTVLDDALRAEGLAREVTRSLQQLRKDSGLEISDRIRVAWASSDAQIDAAIGAHHDTIAEEVLAVEFAKDDSATHATEINIDGALLSVTLTKA